MKFRKISMYMSSAISQPVSPTVLRHFSPARGTGRGEVVVGVNGRKGRTRGGGEGEESQP